MEIVKKLVPMTCMVYDGQRGAGVLFEWKGFIRAVGGTGEWEEFNIVLNMTRLAIHEIIFGLPWMGEVGCSLVLAKWRRFFDSWEAVDCKNS